MYLVPLRVWRVHRVRWWLEGHNHLDWEGVSDVPVVIAKGALGDYRFDPDERYWIIGVVLQENV